MRKPPAFFGPVIGAAIATVLTDDISLKLNDLALLAIALLFSICLEIRSTAKTQSRIDELRERARLLQEELESRKSR